jgi:hypothetical protein
MPQTPNPPIMIVAPSGTSATAASAPGRTLFTAEHYTETTFVQNETFVFFVPS